MGTNNIEYTRQYYLRNKEKLTSRMYEKINCPNCGKLGTRCNIVRHQRSKKCLSKKNENEKDLKF